MGFSLLLDSLLLGVQEGGNFRSRGAIRAQSLRFPDN